MSGSHKNLNNLRMNELERVGNFKIYEMSNGRYVCKLLAINGQVLMTSAEYYRLDSVRNLINSVKENA